MTTWIVLITDHVEYRGKNFRQVYIYDPVVVPEGESIQSSRARYCDHRHTSYEAAERCGNRMKQEAELGS